jgi:hypothetical protein
MTLLIAYVLFYVHGYSFGWYVFAFLLWLFHLGHHGK